ncbi:MAG: peptidase T4, partial [Paracoccaceae bacterium]|nr:peptidase T4 [Paracoccaceae bacterium]
TALDGDLVFACSTGKWHLPDEELLLLGHAAATCLARAIARGVYHAAARDGDVLPTWVAMFRA